MAQALLLGATETQRVRVPLRFELVRPLGSTADRDGREDDDMRDQDGVEELGGDGSPRLVEELGKQLLDSRVLGQGCHKTESGRGQL